MGIIHTTRRIHNNDEFTATPGEEEDEVKASTTTNKITPTTTTTRREVTTSSLLYKSSDEETQRRSDHRRKESMDSSSIASKDKTGKENEKTLDVGTTTPTQLRRLGGRMPLSPIAEKQGLQEQQQKTPMIFEALSAAAAGGKMKKPSRPITTNGGLHRNGVNSSSIDELRTNHVAAVAAADVMKIPVDPPGAILGACPMIHYSNNSHPQQFIPYAEHGGGGYHYGGGGGGLDHQHRSFQPMFPSMAGQWGYLPSHQHHQMQHQHQHPMRQQQQQQQQHTQRQYEAPNQQQQHRPSSQHHWAMPQFLAPLVATVRHPFSHFLSSGNVINGNPWSPPNAGAYHFDHTLQHNAATNAQQHNPHVNQQRSAPVPPEPDNDVVTAADESMDSFKLKELEVGASETFFPSTFAPPECIEKIIQARNTAAQQIVLNQQQLRQTRSMTSQSTSPNNDSSQQLLKAMNHGTAATTAILTHQACSPRSSSISSSRGSKVAPLVQAATNAATVRGSSDMSDMPVRTIYGKKVTIIDAARKVFVIDLLSAEVCNQIRSMADDHTREIHTSGSGVENWRTLYTYTKMDLPAVEVKDLVKKYTEQILHDVKKIVGEVFGGDMRKQSMHLRPRSWKEPHLLLYQHLDDGRPDHTGIEMHYDGCDVTWQAMLTTLDEYEGGGTYFRALRKTILLRQGQVLVHPGELYHMGIDISYGVRCLLVCFTDGANPKIMDDSKSDEDRVEYRKNTVLC